MAKILVFLEHKSGKIKKSGLELLTAAKNSGDEVIAIALGAGAKGLATEAGQYGASTLLVNEAHELSEYNSEAYTRALKAAIDAQKPAIVLATASVTGKDLLPRVGGALNSAVATDCTSLTIQGDQVQARRPMYAGKVSAEVTFQNSPYKIVLMRPNSLPVKASGGGVAAVQEIQAAMTDLKTIVRQVVAGTSTKLDLTEANIIVAGGRGMKGPEHFKLLDDLASVLGASVGASRAVVDAGWVPHDMQVGQTGKTVSPTLYIACGISGAIQHLAGMSSSKVIVAINKDKDAPIFQKATYGIVGDVFDVIPLLIQEFKKLLEH